MITAPIVQKVWNFCTTLRDDGVGYGDYLEQLTYLIFLKMADEYTRPPYNRSVGIPDGFDWSTLQVLKGAELETHYVRTLTKLGQQKGMLGQIFTKSQNKIQDPAKLARLIALVDEEKWTQLDADVKGDIYEGLLERNAEDTKSGAGQYFTPRPLIKAMVDCMAPEPGKTIADPACGTGGFFLAAYDFLKDKAVDRDHKSFLKTGTFFGNEIVAGTRRLCLMNMFLHNIGDMIGDGRDLVLVLLVAKLQYAAIDELCEFRVGVGSGLAAHDIVFPDDDVAYSSVIATAARAELGVWWV
jgi:type I restriction enzyme M protein